MRFDQIEQIFTANWLIDKNTAMRYLPMLIAFLKGQELSASISDESDKTTSKPYVVRSAANLVDKWELTDVDIPENSVAVIPIQGVIMKYGYRGSVEIMNRINEAIANPNISSIFFLVETPGGMVVNTDLLSTLITESPKPTMAYVTKMAASAGMWIVSGVDKIVASSKLDEFGSIGVMASIMDDKGLLEKIGIDIKDIYATKSTNKHYEVKELFNNDNDKPIIKKLDYVNEEFHSVIKENLGISSDSDVFTGNMYFADEAIKLGLCHEILPMNEAIGQIHEMGLKNKIKQFV